MEVVEVSSERIRKEVREIRAVLKELTGKVPDTEDIGKLRRKLTAAFAAHQEERRTGASHVVPGLDMTTAILGGHERRAIVDILANQRRCAIEDVIRKAVDEHCVKHGLGSLVHEIQRKDRS